MAISKEVPLTSPESLSEESIQSYRRNGFVRVPGVISKEEAEEYRQAALAAAERIESNHKGDVFTQLVNVWRQDEVLKRLTLDPNVGRIAERLTGVPLRLWHDQVLIKAPQKST